LRVHWTVGGISYYYAGIDRFERNIHLKTPF
jgi:hypothetical protein